VDVLPAPELGLLAGEDDAGDDAGVPLPEDPQPADSAAAATSVTPPSPSWKRFVIISIPFVLALVCSAQIWDRPQVQSSATQCSVQAAIYGLSVMARVSHVTVIPPGIPWHPLFPSSSDAGTYVQVGIGPVAPRV
jgi:hypothetical protein